MMMAIMLMILMGVVGGSDDDYRDDSLARSRKENFQMTILNIHNDNDDYNNDGDNIACGVSSRI